MTDHVHVILSVAKDLHKRHVNIDTFDEITTANETDNPIHNTALVLPADDNSARLWQAQLDAAP
mgnify:CR=1 FL=1